jgi:hypothetical protein
MVEEGFLPHFGSKSFSSWWLSVALRGSFLRQVVDHVISIGVVLAQADSNGDPVRHVVLAATGMTSETTSPIQK